MTARARVALAATAAATGLAASVVPAASTAAPPPTSSVSAAPATGVRAAVSRPATIRREPFGVTAGGEQVDRYTPTNTTGMRMKVLTYGGGKPKRGGTGRERPLPQARAG